MNGEPSTEQGKTISWALMDKERRKTLVTILIEVGKFTTGGLVIGYFVAPRPISSLTAILGFLFALMCFAAAVLISKE